jgi:hypothetical protein
MGEIIGIESIEQGLCSDFEETVRSEHRSDCARDVSIGISRFSCSMGNNLSEIRADIDTGMRLLEYSVFGVTMSL